MSATRYWAIVPAAGSGRRMAADRPKQYLRLAGRTVLEHSLRALLGESRIEAVVVAVAAGDRWFEALPVHRDPRILTATGGAERRDSVLAGLDVLGAWGRAEDWVLVHDAARPCLPEADLARLIDCLNGDPVGGLLAAPVRDTMKRATTDGRVLETVHRAGLWHALTPQMFRLETLDRALRAAGSVTDEAAAVEALGLRPRLVEGSAENIKVTHPGDIPLAAAILAAQQS